MSVIKEGKVRLLCTICGEEIILQGLRDTGQYKFRYKGKAYPVYEYKCPVCFTTTHISSKFLDDLEKD